MSATWLPTSRQRSAGILNTLVSPYYQTPLLLSRTCRWGHCGCCSAVQQAQLGDRCRMAHGQDQEVGTEFTSWSMISLPRSHGCAPPAYNFETKLWLGRADHKFC